MPYVVVPTTTPGCCSVLADATALADRYGQPVAWPPSGPILAGVAPCVAHEAAKRLNRRVAEREMVARPDTILSVSRAIADRFFSR